MGCHLHLRQRLNELRCAATLIGTLCDFGLFVSDLFGIRNHRLGGFALCTTICRGDRGAGIQDMTVVSKGVAHDAQIAGGLAVAVQPCICIGGGLADGHVRARSAQRWFRICDYWMTL